MKACLLILLCFLSSMVIAQQLPIDSGFTNKADAFNLTVNGKKEGKWLELIFNDSTQSDTIGYSLTVYKEDKPNGIKRDYNNNNELYDVTPYVNGLKNGIEKYGTATSVNAKIPWVNGKREGVETGGFPSDTLTWMEKPYHNDTLDGTQKMYYKGKLFHVKVWDKGKLVSDKKYNLTTGEEE